MKEAELASQYALQYGWSAFFIGWQQHISKRKQPITMQEIVALAQQSQNSVIAELPNLIQVDPKQVNDVVEEIRTVTSEIPIDQTKFNEIVDATKNNLEYEIINPLSFEHYYVLHKLLNILLK